MQKIVSRLKMSKKARKEMDSKGRSTWAISPVSRKTPGKKGYDRKQAKRNIADDDA
ncbi:MAG: hypothetical protein IJC48_02985 [Clostridia bacterium]|nr:hypothetical protein [Clostridia bacterium]